VGSYGLGRLASYATTGAIAGAAGSALVRVLRGVDVQRGVALAIGLSLAVSALRLLRTRPAQAPVALRRSKDAPRPPAALAGLLTGFLPCGALASALVIAAGAASWWGGALVMMTFAVASAPGLVAALLAGRAVSSLFARVAAVRYVAAAMLLVAGAWVAARPWYMPERTCHCHAVASRVTNPGGG
jgi:sulfite exporter TauE/SafE